MWAPRPPFERRPLWIWPAALSLATATLGGLVDVRGLLALGACGVACVAAARTNDPRAGVGPIPRALAHAALFAGVGVLFVHAAPGFANPRIIDGVVLGPGAVPYTKYLNYDKGMAGLLLLGLYRPDLPARDHGLAQAPTLLWRLAILVVLVSVLSLAVGFVRVDPKLPEWLPIWFASMLLLTALPEEALFRGVILDGLERMSGQTSTGRWVAVVAAGALFGLTHVAGGPLYVTLATVAGIGYGWVFVTTESIAAAILAHTTLNTVHLLLFTYPAFAR